MDVSKTEELSLVGEFRVCMAVVDSLDYEVDGV